MLYPAMCACAAFGFRPGERCGAISGYDSLLDEEWVGERRQTAVETLSRIVIRIFESIQKNFRAFLVIPGHLDQENFFFPGFSVDGSPKGLPPIRKLANPVVLPGTEPLLKVAIA